MHEFPANSQKSKARAEEPRPGEDARPKLEPITQADQRTKKGLGRKFKGAFIEGNPRMAMESMAADVVVPMIKEMIFEAIQTGFERMIYGESSRVRRSVGPPAYPKPTINYGAQYQSTTRPPDPRAISRRSRERMDFGEIIINSRQEAVDVLDTMYDVLSRYDSVPVATLYSLTGIATSHADHKWGWTSLTGSKVAKMRDGRFLLDLPEPIPLER